MAMDFMQRFRNSDEKRYTLIDDMGKVHFTTDSVAVAGYLKTHFKKLYCVPLEIIDNKKKRLKK